MSIFSDFSTLTDFRDFRSTLERALFTSADSSPIVFSFLSAGVRERFFDDEECDMLLLLLLLPLLLLLFNFVPDEDDDKFVLLLLDDEEYLSFCRLLLLALLLMLVPLPLPCNREGAGGVGEAECRLFSIRLLLELRFSSRLR